jgi:hypothetical protein
MDIKVFAVDKEGSRFGSGPIEGCTVSQITWELNGAGSASIAFHPLALNARHVKLLEREIQIWFDEDLIWWGIPMRDGGDLTQVTIECDGLLAHFRDRIVDDATLLYTSIDQLNIAWNLIAYAQSEATQANRDFNISAAAFAPSGKIRSREYKRTEHGIIYDLLADFPALEDGFDHEIVTPTSGGRFWTPYYPRKGVTHNNLKLVIREDVEKGVGSFTWQSDATMVGTHVYATGGSSGDVKFENNYEDATASARFGVRQRVVAEGSQSDVAWLLERATKEVSERNHISENPTVAVVPAPLEYFGTVHEGDWIPFYMDYGYYQLDANFRIGSVQWTPEALNLTFIEEVEAA